MFQVGWGPINTSRFAKTFEEMEKKQYKSLYELITDVKWMQHTLAVHFPKNKKITKKIVDLISFIEKEVDNMKDCVQCYINSVEYTEKTFVMPCDIPHVLVWAKFDDYCFWPCKVMGMTEKILKIRFFGDHCAGNC